MSRRSVYESRVPKVLLEGSVHYIKVPYVLLGVIG